MDMFIYNMTARDLLSSLQLQSGAETPPRNPVHEQNNWFPLVITKIGDRCNMLTDGMTPRVQSRIVVFDRRVGPSSRPVI